MPSTRRSFFGQIAGAIAAAKALVAAPAAPPAAPLSPVAPPPVPYFHLEPTPDWAYPPAPFSSTWGMVSSATTQMIGGPFDPDSPRFLHSAYDEPWTPRRVRTHPLSEPAAPTLAERLALTDARAAHRAARAMKVGE